MTAVRRLATAALAALVIAPPIGGAVADTASKVDQVAATVTQIEALIAQVDAMIDDQDARLVALYEEREADEEGPRRAALDQLIDTLTLQLDEAEALRETLAGQAAALRETLATVDETKTSADPETNTR